MKLSRESLVSKCSHGSLQAQDKRTEIMMGDRVATQPVGKERSADAGQMNPGISTMVSNPTVSRYLRK